MKKLIIILTILMFTSIGWSEESDDPIENPDPDQETMRAFIHLDNPQKLNEQKNQINFV